MEFWGGGPQLVPISVWGRAPEAMNFSQFLISVLGNNDIIASIQYVSEKSWRHALRS